MKVFDTRVKVRYCETDQMGIVHHSRYYPWFEEGRTELFASGGMSYGEMERRGVMLPLIETQCRYIHPAKYEDALIIHTAVAEINPVKIRFSHEVERIADGLILARGMTMVAFTDTQFRPFNVKKHVPEIWDYINRLIAE